MRLHPAYNDQLAAVTHTYTRQRLGQVPMQQSVLSAPLQAAQSEGTQVCTATLTGAGAGGAGSAPYDTVNGLVKFEWGM